MASTDGATAVEFALVSTPFILTLLFFLTAGWIIYLQQSLDAFTLTVARQVMIGAVQKAGTSDAATFKASYVCPTLPASFSCGDVVVNLYQVTEGSSPGGYYNYVNSTVTQVNVPSPLQPPGQFQAGTQGAYQYLQVLYPVTFFPSALATVLGSKATYNGAAAYVVMSTAAFRNEQY